MTTASICGPNCGAQLYVHVVGATVLFGSVLAVAIVSLAALRVESQALMLRRLAFWLTALAVVPAWILMYFGGFWLLRHEHLNDNTPSWADAGINIAHIAAVLTLLLLVLGGLSRRWPKLGGAVAALSLLYIAALAFAWFAMSGKPSL